jgi:hypothetical protein
MKLRRDSETGFAPDNNVLEVVKKGESLSFGQWADFFLKPIRSDPAS